MIVNQSDLNNFHDFATHLLAQSGRKLSLEELITQWRSERDLAETVESVRHGVADAAAGRVHDLADADVAIRRELGFSHRVRSACR